MHCIKRGIQFQTLDFNSSHSTQYCSDVQAIYYSLPGTFLQGRSFAKHIRLNLLCNAGNGLEEVSGKRHQGENGELSPCLSCPTVFMPCAKQGFSAAIIQQKDSGCGIIAATAAAGHASMQMLTLMQEPWSSSNCQALPMNVRAAMHVC